MNNRNTELMTLLVDLQKIDERFSDICGRMTSRELEAAESVIPDVEYWLFEAAGGVSSLIMGLSKI